MERRCLSWLLSYTSSRISLSWDFTSCLFLIPEVTYSQVLISFPSSLSSRISFLWQIIGGMGMLLDGEKRRDGWIPGFEWFWNRMPLFSFSQKLVLQQLPCYTLRLVLTSLVSSSIFSWRFAFILLSNYLVLVFHLNSESFSSLIFIFLFQTARSLS